MLVLCASAVPYTGLLKWEVTERETGTAAEMLEMLFHLLREKGVTVVTCYLRPQVLSVFV
jgi:hypothetical protein